MFDKTFSYLSTNINAIALVVLLVLSIYIIFSIWIFIYRYKIISVWMSKEKKSLDSLLMGLDKPLPDSMLYNCISTDDKPEKFMLEACLQKALVKATSGLSFLSVIATTSPFIGLFGTVVSILDAFAGFGKGSASSTLNIIAPAISEALIATAAGIFVAIFAYTFHQILKRKSFELISMIEIEKDIILSK
ncbi:MotA/TolQ/ExbB proton channel family protein [hydrothermal vent metagenome]|uniref:MotA/TolQ/ExbB proton channel family protein n=1 Tax=hydrothermal vent metagenome TaxID=652676 RepID=A0A3B1DUH9_9ZZZZ